MRKYYERTHAAGDLDRQRTERTPCRCFRRGSVDNLISKCPKTPKDDKKL